MINQAPSSMQAFNSYDVLTEMHSCRMNRGNTFDGKKAVRCGKIHHSIIKKYLYSVHIPLLPEFSFTDCILWQFSATIFGVGEGFL